MCGIAGLLGVSDGPAPDPRRLADMSRALEARGPDGGGLWLDPDARIGLAARRLAITGGVADGAQPLRDPASGLVLVFNGEIYNHREIRRGLSAADPEPFRTSSDTETLLRALRQWGEAAVERLEGMFAFAWWDPLERLLRLVRDRAGQKPLFWARTPRGTAFASESRALFASGWLMPRVRPQAIADYLVALATPEPDTCFEDLFAVEAGTILAFEDDADRPRRRRYWSVAALLNDPRSVPAEMLREEAGDLLSRAVGAMTEGALPFACTLSGGVDSQLVAAAAADRGVALPATLDSIGLDPPGPGDEAQDAAAAAAALGLAARHRIHRLDGAGLAARHARLTRLRLDSPTSTVDSVMLFALCERLSREGIRICLLGEGADEIGGYASHLRCAGRPFDRFVQAFTPAEAASLWIGDAIDAPLASLKLPEPIVGTAPDSGLRALAALEFAFRLPAFMAPRVDAPSMACGVELRCPFLHEPLVALMLRAPSAAKFAQGEAKALFRDLHRARFGPDCPAKIGFGRPASGFLSDFAADAPWRSARKGRSRLDAWLDVPRLRALTDPPRLDGFRIFAVHALEAWLDTVAAEHVRLAARNDHPPAETIGAWNARPVTVADLPARQASSAARPSLATWDTNDTPGSSRMM